jgi:fucose 4-O-acetylase-like acetyltransferase
MSQRVVTADTVKGIAIILMVFGHTEQGAMHRHLWQGLPNVVRGVTFANAFIYSFHMAAFFFISGLFLTESLIRRGSRSFVLTKARTLLYPYIVWGVIIALLDPITSRFRSHAPPLNWHAFLFGILTGNASWFLITLFICQLLAVLIFRLPHWLQMLVALGACFLVPNSGMAVFYRPLLFLPLVIAGMWFSEGRLTMLEGRTKAFLWTGFSVLIVLQVALVLTLDQDKPWYKVPMGLLGTAMLFLLSQGIRGTFVERVLIWYGEASLGIFVLSPFFQGAGRELVTRVLRTEHPLPYLAITTIIAATVPAMMWHWQDQLHISWLYRWPDAKKRGSPTIPQTIAG